MGSIGRSFSLFSQSLAILRKDKELLLFPLLSGDEIGRSTPKKLVAARKTAAKRLISPNNTLERDAQAVRDRLRSDS